MTSVYIIVPVFKRLELTVKFYNSVRNQIDNAMFLIVDDSPGLENYTFFDGFNDVINLKTSGDKWWCGTVRVGFHFLERKMSISNSDIIILANNDVTLNNGQWLKIKEKIKPNKLVHPRTITNVGDEVSSGCIVKSWFPYITEHPTVKLDKDTRIDLCTARFLCMTFGTYNEIGNISANLIQYHGDNDFSLRAKSLGIESYVLVDSFCELYDEDTGIKSSNLTSIRLALKSLSSLKSPNNIRSRYNFLRNHFGFFNSSLILLSMTINIFLRTIINKVIK